MSQPFDITVLDDCSDISSWTKTSANGGDVVESTDFVLHGTKSFNYTMPLNASANAVLTKNIAFNFRTDDRLGAIVYLPNKLGGSSSGVLMYGSDAAALGAGTGRWQFSFDNTSLRQEREGWQLIPLSFSDLSVLDGSPSLTLNYASFRFRQNGNATLPRTIYFDSLVRYRSRPCVLFTFDDGPESSYTEGFAYANARGIPLTHYIIPERVGVANFVTAAQVREMAAAGDTIGFHSIDRWDQGRFPETIRVAKASVENIVGKPVLHGAYPEGEYGKETLNHPAVAEALASVGTVTARSTALSFLFPGAYSPLMLPGTVNLQTGTTLSAAKAAVDRAIKHGLTVVIYAHALQAAAGASIWAIADWQALIDYVVSLRNQGLIDCMTVDEWQAGSRRKPTDRLTP